MTKPTSRPNPKPKHQFDPDTKPVDQLMVDLDNLTTKILKSSAPPPRDRPPRPPSAKQLSALKAATRKRMMDAELRRSGEVGARYLDQSRPFQPPQPPPQPWEVPPLHPGGKTPTARLLTPKERYWMRGRGGNRQ